MNFWNGPVRLIAYRITGTKNRLILVTLILNVFLMRASSLSSLVHSKIAIMVSFAKICNFV